MLLVWLIKDLWKFENLKRNFQFLGALIFLFSLELTSIQLRAIISLVPRVKERSLEKQGFSNSKEAEPP